MRKVWQLQLTCERCNSKTMIAILPWRAVPTENVGSEKDFECGNCAKDGGPTPNTYRATLRIALIPAAEDQR